VPWLRSRQSQRNLANRSGPYMNYRNLCADSLAIRTWLCLHVPYRCTWIVDAPTGYGCCSVHPCFRFKADLNFLARSRSSLIILNIALIITRFVTRISLNLLPLRFIGYVRLRPKVHSGSAIIVSFYPFT